MNPESKGVACRFATASRGREHFVFCEQSETKYLVIRDR